MHRRQMSRAVACPAVSTTRRQRITRRLAVVVRWDAGALLVALLVSWALSRTHQHGVAVDGVRRYAISSVDGSIELRYATRTNADFSTNPPSLKDVPFAEPGRRFDVAWISPTGLEKVTSRSSKTVWMWPVVKVAPSRWPQTAEVFSGGEFPLFDPLPGATVPVRYVKFGERTRLLFVPYWIPIAAVAVVFVLTLAVRRRPPAGHCQRCGYDLRASPDRCPECGTAVAI
jgi:hypothetical protein